MSSPETFQDVTVKVPVSRIAEFYESYGRWLRGESAGHTEPLEPPPSGERRPWNPTEDLEVAIAAWRLFPARARALFSTLMDHPGETFTGDDLAKRHAIPNGIYGVAGVLSWPGRYLVKLERELPLVVEANPHGGSSYSMPPALAELFRQARAVA